MRSWTGKTGDLGDGTGTRVIDTMPGTARDIPEWRRGKDFCEEPLWHTWEW